MERLIRLRELHVISDSHDLGGFNHRVLPRDRLSPGGFVIVAAVVPIRVPMIGAEQLAAPTPEPGQTDLPPAAGTPVDLSLHRLRSLRQQLCYRISNRFRRIRGPLRRRLDG